LRAVEDDHVDRPEVQARQRAELTGTNRPTGLIVSRDPSPQTRSNTDHRSEQDRPIHQDRTRSQNRPAPAPAVARHACRTNGAPAVAEPGPAEVPKTCAWPVWWPERCAQNPIPSRTRPLNTPAPMVLCLKTRESRSPPDLPNTGTTHPSSRSQSHEKSRFREEAALSRSGYRSVMRREGSGKGPRARLAPHREGRGPWPSRIRRACRPRRPLYGARPCGS
jgi:hypothetical protein